MLLRLAGPAFKAPSDGGEEDSIPTLPSESDSGHAIGRKQSGSLPMNPRPQLLQGFSRKGSTSLPTMWGCPNAQDALLGKPWPWPWPGTGPLSV